jgi:quercetin dioxygenase-like cupin family protein
VNPKTGSHVHRLATACALAAAALATATPQASADASDADPAIARSAEDAGIQWGGCPEFLPAGCAIGVLHGDPAKPNVDIFLKLPARSKIPSHTHTSAERMVLVAGELRVAYEGQAPMRLTPGTYAYGPAGREHSADCVSDVPCVLFIAFESPLDAIPAGASGK